MDAHIAGTIERLRAVVALQPAPDALRAPTARAPDHWKPFTAADDCRAPDDGPLVSIVTVCKNAGHFLPRAIASVKAQDYRNIEHLVQDGGSTDETQNVVAAEGLLSGFDSASDRDTLDGLLKAARRARGEYIAICWADDELMPGAARWGAAAMQETGADAIYGDQVIDRGALDVPRIIRSAPWEIERFMQGDFLPSFPSSIYRRDILLALGDLLKAFDHDEWEFWAVLDTLGKIEYVPGVCARFHIHDQTRWTGSGAASHVARQVDGRKRAILSLCQNDPAMRRRAMMGADLWAALHLCAWAKEDLAAICRHTESALNLANGDYRFGMLLKRLGDAHLSNTGPAR